MQTLTTEQIAEVLDAAANVDATVYAGYNNRLTVQFGEGTLGDFAQFILAIDNCSSEWNLGDRFARCATNIMHDWHGLEIEFAAISADGFPTNDDN